MEFDNDFSKRPHTLKVGERKHTNSKKIISLSTFLMDFVESQFCNLNVLIKQ